MLPLSYSKLKFPTAHLVGYPTDCRNRLELESNNFRLEPDKVCWVKTAEEVCHKLRYLFLPVLVPIVPGKTPLDVRPAPNKTLNSSGLSSGYELKAWNWISSRTSTSPIPLALYNADLVICVKMPWRVITVDPSESRFEGCQCTCFRSLIPNITSSPPSWRRKLGGIENASLWSYSK